MKPPTFTGRRALRRWGVEAALLLVLVAGTLLVRRHLAGPEVVLLVPEAGAEWLTVDEPFYLIARRASEVRAVFRTEFQVATVPAGAVLTVRALKVPTVLLDGAPVYAGAETANWKLAHQVEVAGRLTPGTHRLEIKVSNRKRPVCRAGLLRTARSVQRRGLAGQQQRARLGPRPAGRPVPEPVDFAAVSLGPRRATRACLAVRVRVHRRARGRPS
jgi:hypothetical protein